MGSNWLRVSSAVDEQGGVIARQRELEELGARLELHETTKERLEQDKEQVQQSLRELEQARNNAR